MYKSCIRSSDAFFICQSLVSNFLTRRLLDLAISVYRVVFPVNAINALCNAICTSRYKNVQLQHLIHEILCFIT